MNWTLIKEKYPKAHKKLGEWLDWDKHLEKYQHLLHNDRDLYDFFDEQDLIIEISYFPEQGEFAFDIMKYGMPNGCSLMGNDVGIKTRTEAEEQAFLKAFEILEDKL